MQLRRLILVLAFSVSLSCSLFHPAFAQKGQTIILDQPDLSVELSYYSAEYSDRASSSGITHEITVQNTTGLTLVAIEVGFISFDPFDNFLHFGIGFGWADLAMSKTKQMSWQWSPLNDFTFYSAVAFVHRMRFDNGDVWEADINSIAEQITNLFGTEVPTEELKSQEEGVLKI